MDKLPATKEAPPAPAPISVIDKSDPRSIVNLMPPSLAQLIEEHYFTNPELFGMDERDLYRKLRLDNKTPSPTDNRIRLKFWDEYDRVQAQGLAHINISHVVANLCTRDFFYGRYLKQPEKMAWLLTPPTAYLVKAEEALEFGLEQLRDILEQSHVSPGGKVDTKLGELKAKIVAMLDNRVKGAVVQRSMNVSLHTNDKKVAQVAAAATAEDLMRQLKDLERKNRQAQNLPLAEAVPGGKPDIEIK